MINPQSSTHEGAPGLQVPTSEEAEAALEKGTQQVRKKYKANEKKKVRVKKTTG